MSGYSRPVADDDASLVDLCGTWRVAPLTTRLHRVGADPDLDDDSWATIDVPGHWGGHSEFPDSDGPLLHRRRFQSPTLEPDQRAWLTFDGVMSTSDIWLDGGFVGATDIYFARRTFEVTDAIASGREHTLAVEVACPSPSRSGRTKRTFTGSLQAGPLAPPGNPGGIWRPVRLEVTGPVAVRSGRVFCRSASSERAELTARVVLDSTAARPVAVSTVVRGPGGGIVAETFDRHDLATGENQLEWNTDVELPMLWWPRAMGDQPLYDVRVEIDVGADHPPLVRTWRTGLRSVEVRNMRWNVNGEMLFVKGVVMGPQSGQLGSMSPAALERDLVTAADAGLDLVRLQAHVTRPEVYDAADRLGLLIWQDLPISGGYAISARRQAQRIARATVSALAHHPSISVWCAHDEPNGPPLAPPTANVPPSSKGLGRHVAPSWNRSVLDPLIRRELTSCDPSRSVILRSGSLPGLTNRSSSDPHLWLGWHTSTHGELPEILHSWPRLGTFLGGFGAQTVRIPESDEPDWDDDEPTWPTAERGPFEHYQPRRAYSDGRTWARATQMYQADLIRSQVGTMRRIKYRPAGGFCLTALFDAEPDGGFGVLDHERRPKPSFEALVDACRPVVVVMDQLPGTTSSGQVLSIAVHAVSDLRHRIEDVSVTARATVGDWSTERRWVGDLPADTCDHVGTLRFRVPDVTGVLTVDIELDAAEHMVTQRSSTVVIPAAEAGG